MKQNPFKAGDLIAAYHGYQRIVGTVTGITGDMVHVTDSISSSHFHWRQCSKLTKKPRKTIWVNEYKGGAKSFYNTEEDAKRNSFDARHIIMDRVAVPYREVREKKK